MLYLREPGASDWVPVGCLTDSGKSVSSQMLPTTTRQTGGWESFVPSNKRYSINFQGLQILTLDGGDTTKMSYDQLTQYMYADTLLEWRLADTELTFIEEGDCYIENLSDAANVGGLLEFSGNLRGTGTPVFTSGALSYQFQDGELFEFQDGGAYEFQ